MNSTVKTLVFWLVIMVSAFLLWQTVGVKPDAPKIPEISYSEFLSQVEAGNVTKLTISQNQVRGRYRDNTSFRATVPMSQEGMLQTLRQKNVEVWVTDAVNQDWPARLMNFAPLLLLGALWLFMIRQMKLKQLQAQGNTITGKP